MFKFSNNIFFKNTLSGILILLFVFSAGHGLFYPKKAEAYVAEFVFDVPLTGKTVGGWIKDAALWALDHAVQIKDLAISAIKWLWDQKSTWAKIAMATFRKLLLDEMVNQIVNWIQGGGDPKFVTDWQGFLSDTADRAGGKVLERMLGEDIVNKLCHPDWAMGLYISLRSPRPFQNDVICTLSEIGANWDSYMDSFSDGGWDAWLKVSEGQNNPYGLYLTVLDKKLTTEANAKEAAQNEAQSGGGFLSDKICKRMECVDDEGQVYTMAGEYRQNEIGIDCDCKSWEVRTPGKIVADSLSKSAFKDIEWLQNNEEWESYMVAITDALINRMVMEGIVALTSEDVSPDGDPAAGGLMVDPEAEPPVTEASPYDAWHIQITSNIPDTFIYYTTDGTEPSYTSKTYDQPIAVSTETTLKWFGIGMESGKEEEVKSQVFSPPFESEDMSIGSLLVAADEQRVALLANKPAVIYYTTDGSSPDLKRLYREGAFGTTKAYMKVIEDLDGLMPISWFAIGVDGKKEKVQQEVATPPFPNYFITQRDMTEPVADVTYTATTERYCAVWRENSDYSSSCKQWGKLVVVELDPSNSKDDDETPQLAMYEWDFDNNGMTDWWLADWDRDGVLGVYGDQKPNDYLMCSLSYEETFEQQEEIGLYTCPPTSIGKGFASVTQSTTTPNGVTVKYKVDLVSDKTETELQQLESLGYKREDLVINFTVTDNEGLYDSTQIKIPVLIPPEEEEEDSGSSQ